MVLRIAPGQRVEPIHAVETADVAEGALAVAFGFLDGAAVLIGLAEHPAPALVAFLLKGLVRSHRATTFIAYRCSHARA